MNRTDDDNATTYKPSPWEAIGDIACAAFIIGFMVFGISLAPFIDSIIAGW